MVTLASRFELSSNYWLYVGYWGMHVACLGALATGVTAADLWLCFVSYLRIFAVTGFYHRYFAHKSYKTSRPMQLALAVLGSLAVQKGVLWWTDYHRRHHRVPDTPIDVHTPIHRSFAYAHSGWFVDAENSRTNYANVPDLTKYPELVWLDRWNLLPVGVFVVALLAFFGPSGLVWGFFIPTVLGWHATHSVGSFGHSDRWGGFRRFPTPDYSRNNWVIALFTLGDGWHNNHHYYPASARNGFVWWEIDITYYLLRAMSALGLIWDLRKPPRHTISGGTGAFREHRKVFQRDLIDFRRRIVAWVDAVRASQPAGRDEPAVFDRLKEELGMRIDAFDDATLTLLLDGPAAFGRAFGEVEDDLARLSHERLDGRLHEEQVAGLHAACDVHFRSLLPRRETRAS